MPDASSAWSAFAQAFAQAMTDRHPGRFVATMSKARRKGKIFIDWLRNQRGSTAILPYSARAREGAPVAVPIGWDALAEVEGAGAWSITDAAELIERAAQADLKSWGAAAQSLPRF